MKYTDQTIFSPARGTETARLYGADSSGTAAFRPVFTAVFAAVFGAFVSVTGTAAAETLTLDDWKNFEGTTVTFDAIESGGEYGGLLLTRGAKVTVSGNVDIAGNRHLQLDQDWTYAYQGVDTPSELTITGKLTMASGRGFPQVIEGAVLTAGEIKLSDSMLRIQGHFAKSTSDTTGRKAKVTTGNLKATGGTNVVFTGADLDLGQVRLEGSGTSLYSLASGFRQNIREDAKSTVKMTLLTMDGQSNGADFDVADITVTGDVTIAGSATLGLGDSDKRLVDPSAPGFVYDADGNLLKDAAGNYRGLRNSFTAQALKVENKTGNNGVRFANADVNLSSLSVTGGGRVWLKSQTSSGVVLNSETKATVSGDVMLGSEGSTASSLYVSYGSTIKVAGTTYLRGNAAILLNGVSAGNVKNADGSVYTVDGVPVGLRTKAEFGALDLDGSAYTGTVSDSNCSGGNARFCAVRADVTVDQFAMEGSADSSSVSLTDATLTADLIVLSGGSVTADENSAITVRVFSLQGADAVLSTQGALNVTGEASLIDGTLNAVSLTAGEIVSVTGAEVAVNGTLTTKEVLVWGGSLKTAALTTAAGGALNKITVAVGTLEVTGSAAAASLAAETTAEEVGTFTNAGNVAATSVETVNLKNSGTLTVEGTLTVTGDTATISSGTVQAAKLAAENAAVKLTGGTLTLTGTDENKVKSLSVSSSANVKQLSATETVTVNAGKTLEATELSVGTTLTNSGTLTANNVVAEGVENAGSLTADGGVWVTDGFSNSGTVDAACLSVDGTFTNTGAVTADKLSLGDQTQMQVTAGTVKAKVFDGIFSSSGVNVDITVAGGVLEVTEEAWGTEGWTLSVGSDSASGTFTAKELHLQGAVLVLDPDWTQEKSTGAFALGIDEEVGETVAALDGTVIVGRNAQLVIGENVTDKLTAALAELSVSSEKRQAHTFAAGDAESALYVTQRIRIGSSDTLAVKGSWTQSSSISNVSKGVTVGANSLLIVDGSLASSTIAVLTAEKSDNVAFTLEDGAMLYVDNASDSADGVLIASGFTFSEDEIAAVESAGGFGAVSRLMKFRTASLDAGTGSLTLYFDEKSADIFGFLPNTAADLNQGGAPGTLAEERVKNLISNTNGMTDDEVRDAFTKIALMNAAGGTQTAAMNASAMISDAVFEHVLGDTPVREKGSAAWGTLLAMTNRASDYRADSASGDSRFGWKSDLTGLALGIDYTKKHLTAGLAASVGTGSVRANGTAAGTKNSVAYFGAHVYGSYEGEWIDTSALAGLTIVRSEVAQSGYKARPTTAALTASVQWEKDLPLGEHFRLTPHAGAKYTRLTGARFSAGGFTYQASDANVLEVPVGLRLTGNWKTDGGTVFAPMLDLTWSRNFGGTGVGQRLGARGLESFDTFDAQLLGRRTYGVSAGLRIAGPRHSLDFGYGLKAGDGDRKDQTLKLRYSYCF